MSKNGTKQHTWTVIRVFGLTPDQALQFATSDSAKVDAVMLKEEGPTCWTCELTWEEAHDKPCKASSVRK